MRFNVLYSCVSHTGNCRKINQDNYICEKQYRKDEKEKISFPICGKIKYGESALLGIFDGMGGEELGEVASLIAARIASEIKIYKNPVETMLEYCNTANDKICSYAEENEIKSMGTTAAILMFTKKEISLCNIGDSKIYRYSDGKLDQISVDHVVVAAHGIKPPLSQNLGIPKSEMLIEPYVAKGSYNNNDIYLICSDGLTDMVCIDDIVKTIEENEFADISEALLSKALENGGKDNITIILCKIKKEKLFNIKNIFGKKEVNK